MEHINPPINEADSQADFQANFSARFQAKILEFELSIMHAMKSLYMKSPNLVEPAYELMLYDLLASDMAKSAFTKAELARLYELLKATSNEGNST